MNILQQLLFRSFPSDLFSKKYPVSVKGVVLVNDKIVLLKNEREEWELPGGKLEPAETAEQCAIREIKEELNIDVQVVSLVDVWMYNIQSRVKVLIVTYVCRPLSLDEQKLRTSNEHKELRLFSLEEIASLNMPDGYKNSIKKALKIIE
jgi:mutator protein MutT